MVCTFSLLVGGECGADPKSKTTSHKILPLVSCSKNISSHKKQLQFSGCKTEIELILAQSACFQTPENMHNLTICPLHRLSLGIVFSLMWRASVQIYWNKRKRLHKKGVQLPKDWFGTPTWPPFLCFGTPTWLP